MYRENKNVSMTETAKTMWKMCNKNRQNSDKIKCYNNSFQGITIMCHNSCYACFKMKMSKPRMFWNLHVTFEMKATLMRV